MDELARDDDGVKDGESDAWATVVRGLLEPVVGVDCWVGLEFTTSGAAEVLTGLGDGLGLAAWVVYCM